MLHGKSTKLNVETVRTLIIGYDLGEEITYDPDIVSPGFAQELKLPLNDDISEEECRKRVSEAHKQLADQLLIFINKCDQTMDDGEVLDAIFNRLKAVASGGE